MDDDMNATPIASLPPPALQSRRPEPPRPGMPAGTPDALPSYQELLREVDYSSKQQQETPQYAPVFEYGGQQQPPTPEPQQYYAPPPPPPAVMPQPPHLLPPPVLKKKRGGLVWQHRHAIAVAVIVLVMLAYGIPKLQATAAAASTALPIYKLSTLGMLVTATASGGMYALVSSYL